MLIDRLLEIREGGAEWGQSGHAQLCKENEDEGFTILSCRYAAKFSVACSDAIEGMIHGVVLFMEVEPGVDTGELAFEAVTFVEGKYFFGDGKTPLRVVWKEERN